MAEPDVCLVTDDEWAQVRRLIEDESWEVRDLPEVLGMAHPSELVWFLKATDTEQERVLRGEPWRAVVLGEEVGS